MTNQTQRRYRRTRWPGLSTFKPPPSTAPGSAGAPHETRDHHSGARGGGCAAVPVAAEKNGEGGRRRHGRDRHPAQRGDPLRIRRGLRTLVPGAHGAQCAHRLARARWHERDRALPRQRVHHGFSESLGQSAGQTVEHRGAGRLAERPFAGGRPARREGGARGVPRLKRELWHRPFLRRRHLRFRETGHGRAFHQVGHRRHASGMV